MDEVVVDRYQCRMCKGNGEIDCTLEGRQNTKDHLKHSIKLIQSIDGSD